MGFDLYHLNSEACQRLRSFYDNNSKAFISAINLTNIVPLAYFLKVTH